jgi:hypothetical protein
MMAKASPAATILLHKPFKILTKVMSVFLPDEIPFIRTLALGIAGVKIKAINPALWWTH